MKMSSSSSRSSLAEEESIIAVRNDARRTKKRIRRRNDEEDDGSQAWCIVICCFLVNVVIMGFLKCLGILIIELMRAFKATPVHVSILVSITLCLNCVAGIGIILLSLFKLTFQSFILYDYWLYQN
jgi:hypothetical protein